VVIFSSRRRTLRLGNLPTAFERLGRSNSSTVTSSARAKRSAISADSRRPQEQRANAVRDANQKDIKKAVKQIEKDRKKNQQ
jgi:hypothetical protein